MTIPIPGNVQGQVGGLDQPGIVEGAPLDDLSATQTTLGFSESRKAAGAKVFTRFSKLEREIQGSWLRP